MQPKIKNKYFIIASLALIFTGCKNTTVSHAIEYNEWLNKSENACKVSKEVNGMIIDVKLLPQNYLALKESETKDGYNKYDSLLKTYEHSTTFLLTFKPKEGHKGNDVMFEGVENYSDYIERSTELNFELESKIVLKTNKGSFAPVLSSLENTYGLTKGRQVYLVFADKNLKNEIQNSDLLDLVYTDDIYNLGILHFTFNYEKIKRNLPQLDLKTI
jgi:hypothetical protein